MAQSRPLHPLRWYEHLALFLLAQSPRIGRILVEQLSPEGADDEPLDDPPRAYDDVVHYLESMYEAPSATFSDEV